MHPGRCVRERVTRRPLLFLLPSYLAPIMSRGVPLHRPQPSYRNQSEKLARGEKLEFEDEEGYIDTEKLGAQQALQALPEQLQKLREVLWDVRNELRLIRNLKEIEVLISEDRKKDYEAKRSASGRRA